MGDQLLSRHIDVYFDKDNCVEVHSYDESFPVGLSALKKGSLEIITSEELAEVKVKLAYTNDFFNSQLTWVGESYVYLPSGDVLLCARGYNPILRDVNSVLCAHQRGEEYYLDDEVADALRERAVVDPEDAMKSGVLLLPKSKRKMRFPVDAMSDEPETIFLFGHSVVDYSKFLQERNIGIYHVFNKNREFKFRLSNREGSGNNTDQVNFLSAELFCVDGEVSCERPFATALVNSYFDTVFSIPLTSGEFGYKRAEGDVNAELFAGFLSGLSFHGKRKVLYPIVRGILKSFRSEEEVKKMYGANCNIVFVHSLGKGNPKNTIESMVRDEFLIDYIQRKRVIK